MESYSNYKHNLTRKFLIGVAPNGTITFVSDRLLGNTSEKLTTGKSGILTYLIASFIIATSKNAMIYITCSFSSSENIYREYTINKKDWTEFQRQALARGIYRCIFEWLR